MKTLTRYLLTGCLGLISATHGYSEDRLCSQEQAQLEARALEILASDPIQTMIEHAISTYAADPIARLPSAQHTLERAVHSITQAMIETAVNNDPLYPKAMWAVKAAHSWFGMDYPNSGYGIENPDNVYRHIPMDGSSYYEIIGRKGVDAPAHQSFTLYSLLPGTGKMEKEGAMILGAVDQLETDAEGGFTVTVSPEPAAGRRNHIQSAAQTAVLIVRDSLTDWSSQQPTPLTVKRVSGPTPRPPMTLAEQTVLAATLLEQAVPFWLDYNNTYIFSKPVNTVATPRTRGSGWGYSTSGHFDLGDEEALVLTLDPMGADYLGFQLADPWGVGLEYVNRTGSLNQRQTRPNADGSITYVISRRDPGMHNWLDTSGLNQGILAIRWQGVHHAVNADMVRQVTVLPLTALKQQFQDRSLWLTTEERAQQLTQRQASFLRRLCQE